MTASPSRAILALVLVTLLAGTAGPVAAGPTAPAQQPLVTELDLQASLTGEVVMVAGWFELTAVGEGRLDTGAQESDLGGTFDVDLAEPFGEFEYRGEVVGTVNASRVLLAFEGNASGLGGGESAAGGAVGASRDVRIAGVPGAPTLETGSPGHVESAPVAGPGGRMVRHGQPAALPVPPFQAGRLRRLGISVFDLYWQLATLVLGLVVVGLLPRFSRRVADLGAGDPLRTGGVGLAVVLVVPVALLVLGLSLFGIPLALAGAAVYLVLWWVGAVYGRFTVGIWLLGAVPRALAVVDVDVRRVENRWAGLLVGTVAAGLLVLIPVVGPLLEAIVLLLGLGGVTRLAYRSYRHTERGERAPAVEAVTGSTDE